MWEAANIAKLWKLPAIYLIENNEYGMGTSTERHSCNNEYYTSGGRVIPGLQINGMDVLAVREGIRHAKEFCATGNGPIFVEIKTYRYHGHSMSDPGITYRDREEVADVRKKQDCIQGLRQRIISSGAGTEDELKVCVVCRLCADGILSAAMLTDTCVSLPQAIEKEVRAEVAAGVKAAKAGKQPDLKERDTEILWGEPPPFIRGIEYESSIFHNSKY